MTSQHFDVLIIGAGLSGIGTACQITAAFPNKTIAILERRERIGGTWDLFRYPGIRSDSDMFTFGYRFRPWSENRLLADGPSIRQYIADTAHEYGIDNMIEYGMRIASADWSGTEQRWTVTGTDSASGETRSHTCDFLINCAGYYNHEAGYLPDFPGQQRFTGQWVHPQHWPEDLDYRGKKVVVIGSGATAVTLLPSLAEKAERVTMLQRSPSYVLSLPARDPLANLVRRWLPAERAYPIVRWKNVFMSSLVFQLARRRPELTKRLIRRGVMTQLPAGYDVDTHFKPKYDPWDQRLCLVPDGDLFRAIRGGRAEVVTDQIETFTATGVQLRSGKHLDADIVITATGLNLQLLGGMTVALDGEDVQFSNTVGYKGMMFSGIPNFAVTIGYTNASWTLKGDLAANYVCRLLNHMDARGYRVCTPREPNPSEPTQPFIDLMSGYVLRSIDDLPKQGARTPWRLHQNYVRDVQLLRRGPIEDEGIAFSAAPVARSFAPVP